ncbi:MAG: hypothetical protein ACD_15C00212G0015 [uncultured bacterium]|nr:MAG: hypothetical protein ACD_15C00212G0015 [uncultured bacterium]
MSLTLHLAIHFFFSILAGLLSWAFFGSPIVSLAAGIAGGFFVDLDHWIDYFIAFGARFDVKSFMKCEQFLKSDKLYLFFHGWEITMIFLAAAIFAQGEWVRPAINAFAWGMLFHLVSDVFINKGMGFKGYSIFYRMRNGFLAEKIVDPREHRKGLARRREYRLLHKE